MDTDASLQASRKKPPPGKVIVVALLGIHGIFLIIIGLIAFFGGFLGVYHVSNGHATPQGLLTWQRWAFWLTIALEITNLIVGGCALLLRLFAPLPIALSMSVAGGILLYVLIVIGPRTLSH